jgi:hypothetical protein
MKATFHLVALLLCLLPSVLCHAADKGKASANAKLTLEDVIFEPTYLTKILGPKTLVVPAPDRKGLNDDLLKVLDKVGVTAKSKVFLLPDGATPPEIVSAIPYSYPKKLRQGNETGKARLLVLVGVDGSVKTLHCYEHTHSMFALAVAAAVVRWKYTPAMINGTPVPVVLEVLEEFRGDGYHHKFNGRPDRDPIERSPPVTDPNRPPPPGA